MPSTLRKIETGTKEKKGKQNKQTELDFFFSLKNFEHLKNQTLFFAKKLTSVIYKIPFLCDFFFTASHSDTNKTNRTQVSHLVPVSARVPERI